MKTYSFIGSDKNAGKTTAFNFLYQLLQRQMETKAICLMSIGINGETVDAYENQPKPQIHLKRDTLFITAGEHLNALEGLYAVHKTFSGPFFAKTYVLATALIDFHLILEGPNERSSIEIMKKALKQVNSDVIYLIDGSIDRQFLGRPSISDGICFALLISERPEQRAKAEDLLVALTLTPCNTEIRENINRYSRHHTKSLLFGQNYKLIYQSDEVPFLDEKLKKPCLELEDKPGILYINGSLSRSLYNFLAPFDNFTVVLDNFTCYQNISTGIQDCRIFKPSLCSYHSVPLTCLFVKQESTSFEVELPKDIPVYNLFRDEMHEIRI